MLSYFLIFKSLLSNLCFTSTSNCFAKHFSLWCKVETCSAIFIINHHLKKHLDNLYKNTADLSVLPSLQEKILASHSTKTGSWGLFTQGSEDDSETRECFPIGPPVEILQ